MKTDNIYRVTLQFKNINLIRCTMCNKLEMALKNDNVRVYLTHTRV